MDPLQKLVAYILLTVHPDAARKLSTSANPGATPPRGISMYQLIRAVESRGQTLLKSLLQNERKNKTNISSDQQEKVSRSSDGATNTSAVSAAAASSSSGNDIDEDLLLNANAAMENEDDDDDGEDYDDDDSSRNQNNNNNNNVNSVFPQNEPVSSWVPRVVQNLIGIGALVNENAGIENRQPLIRLTKSAYAAAWHTLAYNRASSNASTIAPTELQRRKNLNKNKKTRQRKQSAKKSKRNPVVQQEKKQAAIQKKRKQANNNNKKSSMKRKGGGGTGAKKAGKKKM